MISVYNKTSRTISINGVFIDPHSNKEIDSQVTPYIKSLINNNKILVSNIEVAKTTKSSK